MKYLVLYNEAVKDFLKPKSDDRIGDELFKLSPDEILEKSIEYNYLNGFKYLCNNNLVDETTKYLLEKYKLGLHTDEMKDYEKWFLDQLTDLNVYISKYNKNLLIYQKEEYVLFNYDEKKYVFFYDYTKIYSFFKSKFNFNNIQISILVKGMVEEHLKIRVDTTAFGYWYSRYWRWKNI